MVISSKTRVIDPNSIESRKIRIARAYMDKPVMVPTMTEQAEALVAKALVEKEQIEQKVSDNILVEKTLAATDSTAPTEDEISKFFGMPLEKQGKARVIKVAKLPKPALHKPTVFRPLPHDVKDLNAKITGFVRFDGGSAYVQGYDELVITHEYANQIIELGSWDERDSFYRIDIKIPRGEVRAQVYNRDGILLAEGRLDLSAYPWDERDKHLDNIELSVLPIQEGLKARVVAASTRGQFIRKNLEKANLSVAGLGNLEFDKEQAGFLDTDLIRPSIALIRASLPNFWPSIKLGRAAHTTYLNLFTDKSVSALQKIVLGDDPRKDLKENSLIWGRVTHFGKALSGVVVDLAYREDEKVVYFTGPIPDETQIMTSDNGEFSIIAEDEGLEILRVQQVGQSIMPLFIPTLKGHISDIDLQVLPYRQYEFQSYEAFSGLSLPMAMNILGEEDALESNDIGFTSIRRRPMLGSTLIEADAGERFAMTRFSITERTDLFNIPFFNETWIDNIPEAEIKTQGRAAIGNVIGADFTVELVGLADGASPKITYFNPDGSQRTESWGVVDGGYVIKGLPVGLNSIAIRPIGSEKVVTELIVTDHRAVHYNSTNLLN